MSSKEDAGAKMLEPGQMIRPQTTLDTAKQLVEKLYGLKVKTIKELVSYDDRNYHVAVDEEYSNQYIAELWPHGYILKILNSMDTHKCHVDAEHAVQKLLYSVGVNCPQPVLNLEGKDQSKEKISGKANEEGSLHTVRLLTYTEGRIFNSVPYAPTLLYKVGVFLGKIHNAVEGFNHPALANHQTLWNLASTPKLVDFVYAVTDEENKNRVLQIVDAFEKQIVPLYSKFKKSVIHGDYNEQNILVKPAPDQDNIPDPDKTYDMCGVIDFGDMLDSYSIFDVAICIMYMSVDSKIVPPLEVGGHVLAGYLTQCSLNETEWEVLKTLVAARYCQSLSLGAYSYVHDPGNEYLLVTAKNGWKQLKDLWNADKDGLYAKWREIIKSYQKD